MSTAPTHDPRFVADLMAREPIVVRVDGLLADAAGLMDRHGISGLPVVDADGQLAGVISETDLLRARATPHLWASWANLRVRHLMTTPALTVLGSQPLAVAARKMERHHVSRLVVVAEEDGGRPVGVIAIADLLRVMAAGAGGLPGDDETDDAHDVAGVAPTGPDTEDPGD